MRTLIIIRTSTQTMAARTITTIKTIGTMTATARLRTILTTTTK